MAAATAWRTLIEAAPRTAKPFGVLDVGSQKLCCHLVRLDGRGGVELLGAGHQAADGFTAGEITDAAAAEAAIRAVVDEAERSADERLDEIAVVYAGGELTSGYVRVEVAIDRRPVQRRDVAMALRHAAQNAAAEGFAIVHAIPLGESLDGGPEVRDATGLVAKRLLVRAHLVGVRERPLRQLAACLERSHLRLATVFAAPYAAALGTVHREEAERGVLVVDCGARTTTLAVLQQQRLQYVASVPQGAAHLADEIAARLDVSQATAERLKNLESTVAWRAYEAFDAVEIQPVGAVSAADTIEVSRRRLAEILRPLSEAVFGAVREELRRAPAEAQMAARRGVVLTGGGAQQEGIVELAAEMLGGGARLGRPEILANWQDPPFAAASGAIALAVGDDGGVGFQPARRAAGPLARPFESFGQWLRESLGVT